jgi:hypothetical protein
MGIQIRLARLRFKGGIVSTSLLSIKSTKLHIPILTALATSMEIGKSRVLRVIMGIHIVLRFKGGIVSTSLGKLRPLLSAKIHIPILTALPTGIEVGEELVLEVASKLDLAEFADSRMK